MCPVYPGGPSWGIQGGALCNTQLSGLSTKLPCFFCLFFFPAPAPLQAYEATYHLANALTCPVDPGDQLGCLRAMPWQRLIKAMPVVKDMYRLKNKIFCPVVEGFIIPGQILDLMANGQINPGMRADDSGR